MIRVILAYPTFISESYIRKGIKILKNEGEALHKRWSFQLRISPVNVTKSAGYIDMDKLLGVYQIFSLASWGY